MRILRRHVHHLGYPKHFAIYDRGDQETVARSALRDVRVGDEKLRPGDLLAQVSSWKCRSLRPEAALEAAESDKQQFGRPGLRTLPDCAAGGRRPRLRRLAALHRRAI